jgi:hypothetical protein
MKVKIVSDGTTRGTQVLNAETGEQVEGVVGIVWWGPDFEDPAVAELRVEADVELIGKVRVEHDDGS